MADTINITLSADNEIISVTLSDPSPVTSVFGLTGAVDISTLTEKTSLDTTDLFVLEDAAGNFKYVTKANLSLGAGGGASELDELTDVTITTPSNGEVLKYNGSIWVNAAESGGGASAIDDLTDVTITSVASGEVLTYTGSGWENQTLAEAGISAVGHTHATSDITSGTFADARIAESNVTQHEAALTITESQISDLGSYLTDITGQNLSSLADVTITAIASGEILKWDGAGWVNNTLAEAGISATSHTHAASAITSGTFADARIAASNVTQHQAALTITESQISDLSHDAVALRGVNLDATVGSPSDGQILVYRSAGSDWVLEAKPAGGSSPAMADISDVTITSVADNEVLAYDTTSGEWINQTAAEAGLAAATHTHAASDVTSGTFADAQIAASNVTQHQASLTITESQISDLGAYITSITGEPLSDLSDVTITTIASGELLVWNGSAWINNTLAEAGIAATSHTHAASDVTSGTFADARIAASNVTQHQASLSITESQISDLGSYLTDITGENLSSLADVTITAIASGELLKWNGAAWVNNTLSEAGIAAASHVHTTSDITSGTFADARIAESSVTQHQAALSITESQISDLDHDALKLRGVDLDSTVGSPSDGDILVYRTAGSDWVLEAKPAGGSSPAMADITDVTITSVADNEVLAYDSGSGDWINQTAAEAGLASASHTHATSDITSGTFADARIAESNVTQHQAALSITESQISDLGAYITGITGEPLSDLSDVTITTIASGEILKWNGSAWINNTLAEAGIAAASHTHATSDITSGTFADARISESSVTQHQAALSITESQISDLDHDAVKLQGVALDATVGSPSDGDILVYRSAGSDWVLEAKPAGGASPAMADISDVTITSVADNEVLAYDSGSGDWINQTAAEAGLAAASHTHATSDITSGTFADARIAESNVTQHQAALSITESQISDLGSYLTDITGENLSSLADVTITTIASGELLKWNGTAWINNTLAEAGIAAASHTHATSDITSGTFADARIAESNVTQHQAALSITESQISDLGAYITGITGEPLSDLSDVTITTIASGELLKWNGSAWINNTLAEAGIAAASHTHSTSDITSGTFADARIAESNVTQHQAALSITESQISDLDHDAVKLQGVALDATVGSPSDGDILVYRSAGSDWVLETKPAGGSTAINDITDVTITTPADNEVLAYDNGSGEWINQTPAEAGLAEASHTHAASDITSGTLAHERGGLEADVSAYDGLIKITGGSTSNITEQDAYHNGIRFFVGRSTQTATISQDTWTDVTYATEDRKDTGYTHSTSTNPEQVTVGFTGEVLVSYSVGLTEGTIRTDIYSKLQVDTGSGFADVEHSWAALGTIPFASSAAGKAALGCQSIRMAVTSGDIIKASVYVDTASNWAFRSNGSFITIQRIS